MNKMNNGKVDRRVKYTKMVLKESLINLLEQKDISQISIKEICEVADINRATFYSHYNDQYDLLRKIEDELLNNINEHIMAFGQKNSEMNAILLAEKTFEYIKENAKLCKLLLSERGDFSFQKKLMMLVYDLIISELTDNTKISKEDAEYIYSFTITGCVGIVQKWLDDDLKKPPYFMAEIIINLTVGMMSLLKEENKLN
ncbi:TetR/AcrR family transcriptional regulator [Ruminiclostridium herbifermentans]|uniref:TetR/AcrR family transcriptional regulator n=1 Tax=Ruminiclostridium herbifermentans TaxID=2488810 RepID=A0A4U7JCP4_9FIRM|nr:TetR-like C-terminal domain-containing protein [Ruminiclostridium herbifermentans]QNU68130.1 TetR/AcrR family transcriptional regulator [Ruminiclostridium herbifermentans]